MKRSYRYYDLVMALFVSVLLLSNIASSAKLIDLRVSVLGLRLAFDGGTILFPLAYIFGDTLTEVYGYARSRRVIWVGFGCALLMSLTLWALARLPADPAWGQFVYERMAATEPHLPAPPDMAAFGQAAYDAILGGVSTGAIIVASLVAYFAGEFSNSFVLAKLKVRTAGRFLWVRTIGSTLVGQGVDTGLFVLIATALGVFPWTVVLSLIVANYLFKVAVEVGFTPITYTIVNYLKRAENEDYFDRDTNFNPFRFAETG
ncbi:MAG: queuosine precursor transporter [Anaerolineae bacterium]|nr:queuosine precursor transporter [Caldilineales bacterium]MCX7853073.1 queuosine precursor transporter [Caldilineales bacterium]MDW8268404.1 queuosine precursor transporter [Anaerolineae bacterium]